MIVKFHSHTVTYINIHMSDEDKLTDSEDFNFTDIHRFIDQRQLDNDVSEAKSLVIRISALNTDCCSVRYNARILTTQSVVPQNRCANDRMVIS